MDLIKYLKLKILPDLDDLIVYRLFFFFFAFFINLGSKEAMCQFEQ